MKTKTAIVKYYASAPFAELELIGYPESYSDDQVRRAARAEAGRDIKKIIVKIVEHGSTDDAT